MKKSISRKLVAFFVSAVMLLTSTSVVFAENVYTSESGNQWTTLAPNASDCTQSYDETTDTFTSARKIYRINNVNWTAKDGKWTTTDTTGYSRTAIWDVKTETQSGIAQATFDFKFDCAAGQQMYMFFNGYMYNGTTAGSPGVILYNNRVQMRNPNGANGTVLSNDVSFARDTWYTATVVLNMDKDRFSIDIVDQAGNTVFTDARNIFDAWKGDFKTPGPITSISFCSMNSTDKTGETIAEGATVTVPQSVWHIRNLSYDAYTETNFAIGNVYKSTDGLTSNKASDKTPLAGVGLTRLTNIADPANVSLITAAYDADTRMTAVEATPVSAITSPVHSEINGNTVKSFIFDMDSAKPYVEAYQYTEPTETVRSVDFNNGYTLTSYGSQNFAGIPTNARYIRGSSNDTTITVDNDALKFERSVFRLDNKQYKWTGEKVEEVTDSPQKNYYTVKLGETVTKLDKLSIRFKFAGINSASAYQALSIALCNGTTEVVDDFVMVRRYADGRGRLDLGTLSTCVTWEADEAMKANEWYTLDITYNGSTLTATITGKDGFSKSKSKYQYTGLNFDNIRVGSNPYRETAFSNTEISSPPSIKTSVWWIDDFTVQY